MSKRGWLAVIASLTGHGLLVFGIIQLCAFLRDAPKPPKPADLRINAPANFGTVSVTFEEAPSDTIVKPLPKKNDPPPAPKQNNLAPVKTARGQDAPIPEPSSQGSSSQEIVQTGHRETGGIPLHGKITRPGASVVYVLDQSGSMGRERKLPRAIGMLKASLRQLGAGVRFQLVTYDSKATIARINRSSDLIEVNEGNIAKVNALLDAVVSEGSSRHIEGIMTGLSLRPDVLILLTDSDDLTSAEIARIRKWNQGRTTIHVVLFGAMGRSPSPLEGITSRERIHCIVTR